MDDKDLIDRLRLIRTSHIAPVTCQLLLRYNPPKVASQAMPELSARGGRRLKLCTIEVAEKELTQIRKSGAELICHDQEHYPAFLLPYDDAPSILNTKGLISQLNRTSCAIVGARNAFINATHLAKKLGSEIGQRGFVITSGLTRRIYATAHHGALPSGTIAVLANDIDEIYPSENTSLYHEIAAQGSLITEMRYGTKTSLLLFPLRNLIIALFSKVALVIKAALRSGSLVTAREVVVRGIEVMALPSSPMNPRSQGTNVLIRYGATLVQNVDDVLTILSQANRMETPPTRTLSNSSP